MHCIQGISIHALHTGNRVRVRVYLPVLKLHRAVLTNTQIVPALLSITLSSFEAEQLKGRDEFLTWCDYLDYNHELVSYEELMQDPSFHVRHPETDAVLGVKLKCFSCNTNTFVHPPTSDVGKGIKPVHDSTSARTIHGYRRTVAPIRGRYCCANPNCPEVVSNAAAKGISIPDDPKNIIKLGICNIFESSSQEATLILIQ